MDTETAKYIINYFSRLLTGEERIAICHTTSTYKLQNFNSNNPNVLRIYREKGWITADQNVLDLLKDGYEFFELNVANRILTQNPDKVFLNNCPKCNKLARTPYARQCRHCGYNWHDLIVAQFRFKGAIELRNRHFYLLGQITKGEIVKGNYMDLTMLRLNARPIIESIEYAFYRKYGKSWEDIGLGTSRLSKDKKEFLKKKGDFATPFDIINKI